LLHLGRRRIRRQPAVPAAPDPVLPPGRPAGLGDRAARGSSIVLGTQALRAVLQFGSVIVLARLLTPSQFGLVAMVTAVIGVADLVRDFGLSSAAIQAKDLSDPERTNLFWVNLAFGAVCTVATIACAPLIDAAYHRHDLRPIILGLAWVFLISGANTQFRADLTRSMRYGRIAMSDVLSQIVGIAVAVVLAVLGQGVMAIVGQQVSAAVVALGLNIISTRWLPGRPQRGVSLRRFFRFGTSLFATQLLTYFTKNVDNIALGIYSGPVQLGLYSRAYQLLLAPLNQINGPMTGVALPVLSKIREDKERFERYLSQAQLVACYLTATIFAVAAGLAHPLVAILFGPDWAGVAPIFVILAVGGIFRSIQQIAYWAYLAQGKTGAQLRMIVVTRPIMIVIILAGVPWGPIGVATGHSVAYFLFWIVSIRHMGKHTGIDTAPLIRNALIAVVLVCAPAGVVAFAVSLLPVGALAAVGLALVAVAVYLALVVALVPRVRADAQVLVHFLRRGLGLEKRASRGRSTN
jgi:PST family polysaccharide transporter